MSSSRGGAEAVSHDPLVASLPGVVGRSRLTLHAQPTDQLCGVFASYVLTRRYGLLRRRWDGALGALASGRRVATRLALLAAVSGRGEAIGMGPLAGGVSVGAARAASGGSLALSARWRRWGVRVVGLSPRCGCVVVSDSGVRARLDATARALAD